MMKLLWTLFIVYSCLKVSKTRNLRSNRFVDFTIQCRQLSDFTWECSCPQRNVIMTLSNSEDVFLVCGVDFRLSILSKTPRFVPQQQQLASNFDKMVEDERPNKLFSSKNLQSNHYKDADFRDFRDQEEHLQNGNFGKDDFQNAGDDNGISQNGRFAENEFGKFESKKRINDPDDFERNRQFSDYRSKHDYIKGYENYNLRLYASNYVTTTSDDIISEEKLDQNLKKVLSGKMNNLDNPYENERPENPDNTNDLYREKENYQIDRNDDERSNKRHFVSTTIQPRDTKRSETTVRPTTQSTDSTIHPIESVLGNQVSPAKLLDSQTTLQVTTRAPERVKSTVKNTAQENEYQDYKTPLDVVSNANGFNIKSVSGSGDVKRNESTVMAEQYSSTSTKEMNRINKLYETNTVSKDSFETVSDRNVKTLSNNSTEIDAKSDSAEENGCYYSGKMLSVGESFPISNTCKIICLSNNTMKKECSGTFNSKQDDVTESANAVRSGDSDLKNTESTNKFNEEQQNDNINKTYTTLTSESKDGANSSYLYQGGSETSNKELSGKVPEKEAAKMQANSYTRNEVQSVPSTGSTEKQCTAENGCYFSGKILCIGESIPLSYSCRMLCVNVNSMKRDCSAKTLENYKSDTNFSFSKWIP